MQGRDGMSFDPTEGLEALDDRFRAARLSMLIKDYFAIGDNVHTSMVLNNVSLKINQSVGTD